MPSPDRWLVLTVKARPEDPLRDLIAEGLLALGGLSILDEGSQLITYLPPPPGDLEAYADQVRVFLADWIADDPPTIDLGWQANEDWERTWRAGLQPRKVSARFVIKPSWTEWQSSPGEIVVEIDPEMAFGTGEHPTTRGCLRLLESSLQQGDRVCDVGSGSAVLSIAAALAGAREVVAIEYDPDANLNARDNLERNGVGERVRLIEQLADPDLLASLEEFDLILANILSGVIRPLLPAFRASLRESGRLIVSGILAEEREEVLSAAESAGFHPGLEDREEEWWSAILLPGQADS